MRFGDTPSGVKITVSVSLIAQAFASAIRKATESGFAAYALPGQFPLVDQIVPVPQRRMPFAIF